MAVQLYDSLSRTVKELQPSQADGVFRFYNCGPTVYAPAHIGNFRTFVVNDMIRRLAELEFGPGKVRHVRNLTDVDDKTIARSHGEGRPLADVTRQWTEKFHADCCALNCLPPHVEPAATAHIREQADMIEVLMAKGNAYRAPDGSVYFKVSSFPGYGALSRLKERELQPGSAFDAADADAKEDGSDFALWKAWKPEDGTVKWTGPRDAAEGRPGWHIECSAMSKRHLGSTIDLHTGGVDLLFPHHENEIAQSECCNGTTFSRHWYHSEHLLVDGKKMSKSLGNLYTLDELVSKGFSPMAVRYTLLAGHPRKQLNFTLESLHAAESALKKLKATADSAIREAGKSEDDFYNSAEIHRHGNSPLSTPWGIDSLRDDLNTPKALGELFTERKASGGSAESHFHGLARIVWLFGFDLRRLSSGEPAVPAAVTSLADRRWAAKQARDFAAADALRKELAATGWSMLDRKDGFSLEPLKR